jgi:excisionase family DNA binding protein
MFVETDGWDSWRRVSIPETPLAERKTFSLGEVAELTGLCVSTLYNFMGNGRLQTIKVGGRRLVTRKALDALLRASGTDVTTWLGDPDGQKKPVYDGTVAALIRCYQTDKNSPYHGLRQSSARVYTDWCRTLERAARSLST